ncbi:hypothetical protein pipiens_001254 [Culex pipiens pipiens]|uniref:Carboxylic ester hydrolase n=1 Tax=Culex pipiens pipiens TaxID=38569 RepID=A0ABD1D981_CULPP
MEGYQAGPFNAFIGIPYAKPPTEELRFSNPVRNEPWKRGIVYNATEDKPMCVQKNDLLPNAKVSGEEDCLYLNVYQPMVHSSSKTPLPVMVYIHGGGFFAGGASPSIIGPEYFMDTRRVILVTFQYRLGVFGFLSTGDEVAPGNFGLKDQVMALRWVKHNIASFGGNPDLVTIFGQSAGGASVHMHMISPMSDGLFSRAIVMSGNAIAPWNIPTEDPLSLAQRQAEAVGIAQVDKLSTKQLVDALRNVDANVLSESIDKLKFWSIDPLTFTDEKWITTANAQRLVDLYTEAAFLYPIHSAVKQHVTSADTKLAPVSIYKFSFKGPYSYSFLYTFTHQDFGVVHCDELIYLFRSPALFPDFPHKSKEARMSHHFVEFFIDFAINGVATPLKPYRGCNNDNEVYQSMDCDVLEFINSSEPGKPFEFDLSSESERLKKNNGTNFELISDTQK